MKYCRLCKRPNRFQIKQPNDLDAWTDFMIHQVRAHDLIDIKFFSGSEPASPAQLIMITNQYRKLPRKLKKQRKKLQAKELAF